MATTIDPEAESRPCANENWKSTSCFRAGEARRERLAPEGRRAAARARQGHACGR